MARVLKPLRLTLAIFHTEHDALSAAAKVWHDMPTFPGLRFQVVEVEGALDARALAEFGCNVAILDLYNYHRSYGRITYVGPYLREDTGVQVWSGGHLALPHQEPIYSTELGSKFLRDDFSWDNLTDEEQVTWLTVYLARLFKSIILHCRDKGIEEIVAGMFSVDFTTLADERWSRSFTKALLIALGYAQTIVRSGWEIDAPAGADSERIFPFERFDNDG